jgi:hypothetical protein
VVKFGGAQVTDGEEGAAWPSQDGEREVMKELEWGRAAEEEQ